jgi:hypothetical protein
MGLQPLAATIAPVMARITAPARVLTALTWLDQVE